MVDPKTIIASRELVNYVYIDDVSRAALAAFDPAGSQAGGGCETGRADHRGLR